MATGSSDYPLSIARSGPGSARPCRSSSQAIALILQPAGVRMNWLAIMPRAANGTPPVVPALA
jgi:hypothetical protein